MLVEAAAAVVEQRSKHEELDVAAHAITANSAQLVSNSRQKVLPSGAESRDGLIAAGVRIMNATTVLRWHSVLTYQCYSIISHPCLMFFVLTLLSSFSFPPTSSRAREGCGGSSA